MSGKLSFMVLGCSFLLALNAQASSITLKFDDGLADQDFSIESGGEVLADGKLSDDTQTIDVDALLAKGSTRVPAKLTVDGHREFALGINLFRCETGCKWRVVMSDLASPNSNMVGSICRQDQDTIEGLYEKYFFCRGAYMGHFAAGGLCWPEAKQALSGWFDAAYQLHTRTLKDGTAFVARDKIAEAYVRDAQLACKDFEGSVRKAGYFAGMFRQLDRALLQATQRVEKLLQHKEDEAAKRWAETIVQDIGTETGIRNSLPREDVIYVEAILNRALQANPKYTLP